MGETMKMNEKLLTAFKKSDLTADRLSELSGVGRTTVYDWIAGNRDLRISTAEKIAVALGKKITIN